MKSDSSIINFARLRTARGNRSLREVALFLGITKQQLWNIETGKRKPSLGVLVKLCAFYDLPIEKIIGKSVRAV
jgi:transcriptional regulator with XRE-family HTH domain